MDYLGAQIGELQQRHLAIARYQHGLDPVYSTVSDYIALQQHGSEHGGFQQMLTRPSFPLETLQPYSIYPPPPPPSPSPPQAHQEEEEDAEA